MEVKKEHIFLAIIILSGFLFRVYNLDSQSMWIDESHTIRYSMQSNFIDSLNLIRIHDGTPPLYYTFMWGWTKFFGDSEFYLRFPSVIFGTISIWLIFLFARTIFNKKIAFLSAIIMSFSMIQVLYSQEARAYALFTMLGLLSSLFFVHLIKNKSNKFLMWYIFFSILLLYTHYLSIYIIILQGLVYLFFYKELRLGIKKEVIILAIFFIAYLPLVFLLLNQVKEAFAYFYDILYIKLKLPIFLAKMGIINMIIPLIVLSLLVIFAAYNQGIRKKIVSFCKKIKFNEPAFFYIMITLFLVSVILSKRLDSSIFITRYTHFMYPFIYILIANGIIKTSKKRQNILIMILIITSLISLTIYHSDSTRKEQWRELAEYVISNSEKDDVLLINSISLTKEYGVVLLDYYNVKLEKIVVLGSENSAEMETYYEELKPSLSQSNNVWIALSHSYIIGDFYNNKIEQDYALVKTIKYKGIALYQYKRDKK